MGRGERERKEEGGINVRDTSFDCLVAPHKCPDWGQGLDMQPRYELPDPLCTVRCSDHWACKAGQVNIFIEVLHTYRKAHIP